MVQGQWNEDALVVLKKSELNIQAKESITIKHETQTLTIKFKKGVCCDDRLSWSGGGMGWILVTFIEGG